MYFSPKNAWSYFEKKNWYRFHISCKFIFRFFFVFTFHVHLAFERHMGTEGSEPLLSCSVYFVRIPLPFELIFVHQCPKDYCFDVIHHALKIQRKTVVQTKLKQHVITGLYYLRHISAGIEKHSRLMKQIISSLQFFSMFSHL